MAYLARTPVQSSSSRDAVPGLIPSGILMGEADHRMVNPVPGALPLLVQSMQEIVNLLLARAPSCAFRIVGDAPRAALPTFVDIQPMNRTRGLRRTQA